MRGSKHEGEVGYVDICARAHSHLLNSTDISQWVSVGLRDQTSDVSEPWRRDACLTGIDLPRFLYSP